MEFLRVISRRRLREFWERHKDAETSLRAWYAVTRRATWRSIVETKEVFPHADAVGDCTVFNIKGNDYRLITKIHYRGQRVFIRYVLTHAEYDRDEWKKDCGV